jgi:hypothetical protein
VTVNLPSLTTYSPQTDHKNTTVAHRFSQKPLQKHTSTTRKKTGQYPQPNLVRKGQCPAALNPRLRTPAALSL